ncbi:MAG: RecB-family nuclease [Sulfolobaceae archaeon]
MEILVNIHNITSAQRVIEISKLALSHKTVKNLVLTKVGGTAAQSGIPEVFRFAYKLGKSIMVLPDLKDTIELLKPDKVILISSKSNQVLTREEIKKYEKDNKKILIVIPGNEAGFTKIEESLGEIYRIESEINVEVSPIAILGIILYCILS